VQGKGFICWRFLLNETVKAAGGGAAAAAAAAEPVDLEALTDEVDC
jgi:hypothetical protein